MINQVNRANVERVYTGLESKFDSKGSHPDLSMVIEAVLLDPMVADSLDNNPEGQLIADSVKRAGERMETFDEDDEAPIEDIVKTLTVAVTLDAISDSLFESVVAGTSYYCVHEGLINDSILNIDFKTSEDCLHYFRNNMEPFELPEITSIGIPASDLVTTLYQSDLVSAADLERYTSSLQSQVLGTGVHQTMATLGTPLNEGERKCPYLSPSELGLDVTRLVALTETIGKNQRPETGTDIAMVLSLIQPDLAMVVKTPVGDYEANSIIGVFVTFISALLYGINKMTAVSFAETLPLYRYVRDTLFQLTRNENRYYQIALMATNACVGLVEYTVYGQYGDVTVTTAVSVLEYYHHTDVLAFKTSGTNRHGVPEDIYVMMISCIHSTVFPVALRETIRDERLYPAVGPVRLIFESTEFKTTPNTAVSEDANTLKPDDIIGGTDPECASKLKDLLALVDPGSDASCAIGAVDAGSDDSGGVTSVSNDDNNPLAELSALTGDIMNQLGSVRTGLQESARIGRMRFDVSAVQTATVAEQMITGICEQASRSPMVDVTLESLNRDIVRNMEWCSAYKRLPSYIQATDTLNDRALREIKKVL